MTAEHLTSSLLEHVAREQKSQPGWSEQDIDWLASMANCFHPGPCRRTYSVRTDREQAAWGRTLLPRMVTRILDHPPLT